MQDPKPADSKAGPASPTTDTGSEPIGSELDEPAQSSAPVPEPSTLLLVGSGLVGVALSTRLRRRKGATS